MSEINFFRLIDAYFDGTIKPTERIMLENKIQTDPLLKAEFDLQQNIVNGLGAARKAELKQRLSAIDVSAPVGIASTAAVKWITGSLIAVSLIGGLLYWNINNYSSIIPLDLKYQDAVTWKTVDNLDIPESKSIETQISKEQPSPLEPKKSDADLTVVVENTEIKTADAKESAKVKPQSLLSFEDDALFQQQQSEGLERLNTLAILKETTTDTEIEIFAPVIEEKYHYRYFNNKLYLYGNFDQEPYEIVELNNKGDRQLFLSYKNNIYVIEQNVTETAQLKKLNDKMLTKELMLIINE